jgi:predicted transporter
MTAQWWAEFLTAFILIRIGIIIWRKWKNEREKE